MKWSEILILILHRTIPQAACSGFLLWAALSAAAGDYIDTVMGTSHMVQSDKLIAAIHLQSGHIKGLWDVDAGQQYLVESYDQYYFQTEEKEWEASEKDDIVTRIIEATAGQVILACTNAALPTATIEKRYFLAEAAEEKRILCRRIQVTGNPEQPTLFTSVSQTVFDPDFRKDARYHYVVPQGVAGNQQPVIHARDITRPIARRDHYIDEAGRAACDAFNPTVGAGFAQYFYKINDGFAYPRSLVKQTYWTSDGWQMGSGGFFVREKPVTVETRYHLFTGDRLQIHFEYLALPEHKVLRDATQPLPVVASILHGSGKEFLRPGDHTIGFSNMNPGSGNTGQYRWGVFADADDVVLEEISFDEPFEILQQVTALSLKERFAKQRAEDPGRLMGLYIYRSKPSPVLEQHPEWIKRVEEKREIYYAKQIPEVSDYLAEGTAREADYLGAGLYYVDGAIEAGSVDWNTKRVIQIDAEIYQWKRLYEELHKRGKLLWTNMRTGSFYYDVAYYEGSGAQVVPGKTWRDGADMDLMNKIYQVPGTLQIPLYWWVNGAEENNARYQNLCLGLAMTPRGGAWAHQIDGEWPVLPNEAAFGAAVHEYQAARFTRIGLQPAWWNDLDTPVEGYTLKNGNAYFVNVTSHYGEPRDIEVSVDPAKMGFAPGEPIFIWQHQARPALIAGSQYDDDALPRIFSRDRFQVVTNASARLTLNLEEMPVDRIRVNTLTQVPGFIYSADGLRTQTYLPETLGCSIHGRLHGDSHQAAFLVRASRPIQILAYWPENWGEAQVFHVDRITPHQTIDAGGNRFLLLDCTPGITDLTIRPKPAA